MYYLSAVLHTSEDWSLLSIARNASASGAPNGVLVNGNVKKHNSTEHCDLGLQERYSDAIPARLFSVSKFSFSSYH
jgi:hypothetical protein